MKTNKPCCFCRVSLDRHAAVLWDGYASACVTKETKLTKQNREDYQKRLKGIWKEWGRAFEGGAPKRDE